MKSENEKRMDYWSDYVFDLACDNGLTQKEIKDERLASFMSDVTFRLFVHDLEQDGQTVLAQEFRERFGI